MTKLSIIGAGRVGSNAAYLIALENIVDEIVLIDVIKGLAKGEALDISECCGTKVSGSADIKDIQGSDIVVITAGSAQRKDMPRISLLEKNASIIKEISSKLSEYAKDAKIIVVTNPMDLMTLLVLKITNFDPRHVFGQGNMLDSLRFKYFLSQELNTPVEEIQAVVIGTHTKNMIPVEDSVKANMNVNKQAVKRAVESTKKAADEIIALKDATYYAPGVAIRDMVRAIVEDKKEIIPASTYLEEHDICIGVPCTIGKNGIESTEMPQLTQNEQEQFSNSIKALQDNKNQIQKYI